MSTLQVENLIGPTSGSNANKVIIPSGQTLYAAGHVIQVVNNIQTAPLSSTSTTFAAVSGLTVNITPKSSTSKFLVEAQVNNLSTTTGTIVTVRLVRDSTVISGHSSGSGIADSTGSFITGGGGDAETNSYTGGNPRKVNGGAISFLDSPSTTSALTYKVEFATATSSQAVYLNRWALNSDMGSSSSITVMEIAQ
ncbi:hypothetical protein N9I05_01635 [Pseudomonadales bacterium]|nr:hypothetical protein [Pseudomonadales bacterium]